MTMAEKKLNARGAGAIRESHVVWDVVSATGAYPEIASQWRETDYRYTMSIVVPTRDESENVRALLARLRPIFAHVRGEVIFVDDSDDDTPRVVQSVIDAGRESAAADTAAEDADAGLDVVLMHRPRSKRAGGLGGAVAAGLRIARAPWVCVMDGDLQHPPEVVPELLAAAHRESASLVVASRYGDGGSAAALGGSRTVLSRASAFAARTAFPKRLRAISDPMSGFFLVRRDAVNVDALRPDGFKILLEIAVRNPALRLAEVTFTFRDRYAGTSKADSREGLRYLRSLARTRLDVRRESTFSYDVHGIVTVESDAVLPELEAFRVRALADPPTIRVRLGAVPKDADPAGPHVADQHRLRYREMLGNAGFAAEVVLGDMVEVLASRPLRHSPHVLYTNLVEPILRWTLVARGYALVHGACVVDGDDAYMITARTDTGKTTTMLKLLDARPYRFVADDLTIVCSDGRVLPYPKPLTISAHTLAAVKRPRLGRRERLTLPLQSRLHSRSGRRFAFFLTRTGLPVATVNAYVQFLVPPPKYPVDRLVPGVEVAGASRIAALFVIQRSTHEDIEALEPDDALEILLANCEDAYGFPPYEYLEAFLLGAANEDLRAAERHLIARALRRAPATLLSSAILGWAERIPTLIDELAASPDLSTVIDLREAGAGSGTVNGSLGEASLTVEDEAPVGGEALRG